MGRNVPVDPSTREGYIMLIQKSLHILPEDISLFIVFPLQKVRIVRIFCVILQKEWNERETYKNFQFYIPSIIDVMWIPNGE